MKELGITRSGQLSDFSGQGKFWRRQFAEQETLAQFIFDGTFGVIAPLLCLIFDPIVFQNGIYGPPLLDDYRFSAYAIIFIEITVLLMWLAGPRPRARARVLGHVMFGGALFSLVIGLVLLPVSLIGLVFYGIGLCGLTPFLTFIIYLRNGRRARRHAQAQVRWP